MTRSRLICNRLIECAYNGELENEEMKLIISELSIMLGLKNLTSYAKSEKISYQAARKRKVETLTIDNIKFIIDNE